MFNGASLHGYLFNARSIVNKLCELQYLLYNTDIDIFVITETWLHTGIMSSLLDPRSLFTILRKDRIESKGGGVCVLVRKPVRAISVEVGMEFDDLEMICFDLIVTGNRVRFFAIYRPPGYDSHACSYMQKLLKCMTRFESTKHSNVILGDLNLPKINWQNLSGPSDIIHHEFLSFLTESSYVQLVTFPTRDCNILDVILTTVPSLFGMVNADIPLGTSDHSSVKFELLLTSRHFSIGPRSTERLVSKVKYNWHKGDYDAISEYLCNIDWLSVIICHTM